MALTPDDMHVPSLFAHATRKDWGVGVLAWDDGEKRGYLFENGAERTMAGGFHELMRKVAQPSADQKAAFHRLQGVLAARASADSSIPSGPSFPKQLAKFHEAFPAGFLDPRWAEQIRGEGVDQRAPQHRAALIREAQAQLSTKMLDPLLSGQHSEQVWDLVMGVLGHTDLVPAVQLKKLKSAPGEQQRELANATRDLLHGKMAYDQRFDRFVGALAAHSGEPARWEIATALSAMAHPTEHVCVHLPVIRLQVKALGSRAAVAARPTSASYARLLIVTRAVAKKLTEQSEQPRDLLDVLDFMRLTLKPAAPKKRASNGKVSSRKVEAAVADDEQDD